MLRETQFLTTEKPIKNRKDGAKRYVTILWPQGIKYPREGGLLDQPQYLMRIYQAFLEGEQAQTLRRLDQA